MAAKGLNSGDVHPVYKAMNTLDYAVGNLGNHEFNYGLEFLHKALAGAKFPYVNANIIDTKTGKPMFTPYLIKETTVQDRDGKTQTLRIGYIGFVPPQIMTWDKANLSGKVTVNDITETARQYVPEMREKAQMWWWWSHIRDYLPILTTRWRKIRCTTSAGARRGCHYVRPRPCGVPGERFCRHSGCGYRQRHPERHPGRDARYVG